MIQRIQTIFMILAACALSVQAFTPLLHSSINAQSGIFQDGNVFIKENIPAYALLWTATIMTIIAIFIFKNRKTQKLLVLLSILVVLACNLTSGLSFFAPSEAIVNNLHASISPGIGAFMPLVGLITLLLAYRGINKDDKIVKSMDRLR